MTPLARAFAIVLLVLMVAAMADCSMALIGAAS